MANFLKNLTKLRFSVISQKHLYFSTKPNSNPKIECTKLFINNEFVSAQSGKTFETVNPCTEQVIASVAEADKVDVDLAVKAAKQAFQLGAPWRTSDATYRAKLMNKLADLIERDSAHLAALESLDNGKIYKSALNDDLAVTVDTLRYYAGWADKIHGKTLPITGNFMSYTRHEPVGVAAQIMPWNFPLQTVAWKIAPALAAGCTVVLKIAEQTPLSSLYLGKLITEAGFPPGVINILTGFGPTAGASLVNHPDVDKISFTGSTEVGKLIGSQAAQGVKRLTLELGGKSPVIVLGDLTGKDLDNAVEQSFNGVFANQGQSCSSGTRIFVQENIYDEFVEKMVEMVKKIRLGDPFDEHTDQGPQIDAEQMYKILGLIESGKSEGATLLTGGARHGEQGFFIQPTVFGDVTDDMTICTEEIFGPVMQILKFKTLEEAVERANNNEYGLASGVFTTSIDNAIEVSNNLRAGSVWVNCYERMDSTTPFGGYKKSGYGRECGEYGLMAFLEVKCVTIKTPQKNN